MSDVEEEETKKRSAPLSMKATLSYSKDDYDTKLKEDKQKRLDYLLTQSEIMTFMGKKAPAVSPSKGSTSDEAGNRRRRGKESELDEQEIEEADRNEVKGDSPTGNTKSASPPTSK
jgi:hypothetical protein